MIECIKYESSFWRLGRLKEFLIAALLFLSPHLMGQTYTLPFQFTDNASSIRVATDKYGHAIAAYNTDVFDINTYYYSNNKWNLLTIPGCPLGTVEGLVMHSEGTALLTYIEDGSNDLRSLYFNGSAWTVPSLDPLDTNIPEGGALAMNANGDAAVVWSDASLDIHVNIFQNGVWGTASAPGAIGTGAGALVGININDDLAVGFEDGPNVIVNESFGGVWTGNTTVNADAALTGIGMDDNGNTIALVRENSTGDIIAYQFSGGFPGPSTTINPGSPSPINTGSSVLGVAPSGTAVAAWNYSDGSGPTYGLYYNQFDGSNWNTPVEFKSGVTAPFTDPAFSFNTNGDALFFFGGGGSLVLSTSFLPQGGSMDPQIDVATAGATPIGVAVSLADTGFNALAWIQGVNTPFGLALYVLAAPTGLSVYGCYDRNSDTQTTCNNYLSWTYSDNVNIASYNILKDGVQYDNVPVNDPQTYTDTGVICGQRVVYTVEAVDQDGVPGMQASVTLN